jgi:hypothetical protein
MADLTRRFFLASLAAPVAFSRSWEQRFPDWTPADIDRILTGSPWARQFTASFRLAPLPDRQVETEFSQIGLPGGIGLPRIPGTRPGSRDPRTIPGASAPTSTGSVKAEAYLTVRWASALPVRQAMALLEFGAGGLQSPRAQELLQPSESEHVVEIAGIPTTLVRQGVRRFEAELARTARLSTDGRKPVPPSAVSVPEHGMHLIATLRFPRLAGLSAAKESAVDLYAEGALLKIEQRFKLKPMIYNGRLEL